MKHLLALTLAAGLAVPVFAQTWTAQTSGTTNTLNAVRFLDNLTGWVVGDGGTTLRTNNSGQTWTQVAITGIDVEDIAFADALNGIMVGDNGSTLRTTNGGTTWSVVPSGQGQTLYTVAYGAAGVVYSAGRDGAVARSTNGGVSWIPTIVGTTRYRGSAAIGNNGWIVGESGAIIATTNGGTTWNSQASGTGSDLKGVFFLSATEGWIAGQNSTLLYTNNGGTTWTPRNTGITVGLNSVFFLNANEGWATGNAGAIFRTTNGGLNWIPDASNATAELSDIYFVSASQGWTVGDLGTIRYRSLPTSVDDNGGTPSTITLAQNYPNPFNPSTSITFQLPESGRARLAVFNLLGQEVATLVDGNLQAGHHAITFDAPAMPSGVYFYKLTSSNGSATRKMTLSK